MNTICARFDLFPDNTGLGITFTHSNYDFSSKDLTSAIAVNESSGEKGITIRPPGISVILITTVDYVAFRVGIWDSHPIDVIARDANGIIINQNTINGHNHYLDSSISGVGSKSIDFETIGNEELLVSICINI